jgi:tetratricopeptide (TPR) repeat protein
MPDRTESTPSWPIDRAFVRGCAASALAAFFSVGWQDAAAQAMPHACGELENAFGPYDYRTERGAPLRLVESAHFTVQVETLIRGKTATLVGQDIDYTLRAFPNHHRALWSTIKLAQKLKTPQPPGMMYSVDCWFDRAMRFRPEDVVVRMIYGDHLAKTGRVAEAHKQLDYVARLAKDDPLTHYHLGLIYVEMKDYERALVQAHRAQALGISRTELRERLQAADRWQDAAPETPPSAAPAAVEAASAPAPKTAP